MGQTRALIKHLFYKTGLVRMLDGLIYRVVKQQNKQKNAAYRAAHPNLVIPPDYYLYETYRLDYEQFFTDGFNTAKEIIDWTRPYLPAGPVSILDWGCGVSRIVQHIHQFVPVVSSIHGCDINAEMTSFNKKSYPAITYNLIAFDPPTNYVRDHFDLVYGLSIFTHIDDVLQEGWVKEMQRILKPGGIFLFTTHGDLFRSKLLPAEKKHLDTVGSFSKAYRQKGHRMMSTYNSPAHFKQLLQKYFTVREFYDGEKNMSKTGGQDLWIVQKPLD